MKMKKSSLPPVFFFRLVQFAADFRYRHSLSAGGQGASSACACGVSLDALFPQESRTFLSNQLCYSIYIETIPDELKVLVWELHLKSISTLELFVSQKWGECFG
ncbi:hypothetical protein ABES21_03340 [Peribacillus frigoritolerans]|uniref:hypothetical protein n=1 Tax=Peribacillus frigoritolerans TaxID=450367 RepID=UPI003D2AA92B